MYINGTLIEISTNSTTDITSNFDVSVGANADAGRFFDGLIDEISLWNVALSATQVSDLFSNGLNGSETGLLHYYTFEDGPGSTSLTDQVGSINGTLEIIRISNRRSSYTISE